MVLVSAFHDEAVRDRSPWSAAELREEVLSGLSRFREIQLVADARPEEDAAETRRHERGYSLTATLLPDGDGVKVVARAKRLADGRVIWGETMSLADTGTAGGVERIVRRIAGAALPAVDDDLFLGLPSEPDDFYDRYLIAKRLLLRSRRELRRGQGRGRCARGGDRRAPRFCLGLPAACPSLQHRLRLYRLGASGAAERDRALKLAKSGLAADRGNVHSHTVLGFCYLWHGEQDLARRCFEQAQTLNLQSGALEECATGWMFMGDAERARA